MFGCGYAALCYGRLISPTVAKQRIHERKCQRPHWYGDELHVGQHQLGSSIDRQRTGPGRMPCATMLFVPYLLLDDGERGHFVDRFTGATSLAALDWQPVATLDGVAIYDLPAK
jgi:hypothetical protein